MIGWKTFCALFLAHRYMGDTSERLDAAMADAVDAQNGVQTQAILATDAAVSSAIHIQAVRSQIALRTDAQEKRARTKRLHTGDVRELVQDMLDTLDGPAVEKKDHNPC